VQLRLEQVSVARRGRALLASVDLSLEPGQLLALLGPNGAGKTTLLRVALGLLRPDSGRVLLGDEPFERLSARQRAARVAWLPQHAPGGDDLSAREVVASARYRFDEPFARSASEAQRALERLGVGSVAERPLGMLSGGERQRVSLAGLLAQDAPLLLVDEPANHLDPAQQIDAYRLLGELWRSGRGVLCVTHDVNLLRHLGDAQRVRVAGMSGGKLAFECSLTDGELPQRLGSLFGVRMHELELGGARVLLPEPNP
jgi:iron complex transport system ATP-binding protein